MAHHAFQQFSSAAPPLHSLPPGCKYLSCREARDVLQTCPTYRLADGSIVAPVGGELYQVLEIPTNCDERCLASHRPTSSCHSRNPRRFETPQLHNNEWLRFRRIGAAREETDAYRRSQLSHPRLPLFYTDGQVCPCQLCISPAATYPERLFDHHAGPLEGFKRGLSPAVQVSPEPTSAPTFAVELPQLTPPSVGSSSGHQRRQKQKRFQCIHCDKSFGKSSHLRDHIRTHTGDRPFRCQYCNKAFTQYSNLRTHTRIHTGEKPFKCQHCSKSFTQAVTLRSHTRTHTGDKPYNCKLCTKSFACFSGLKGHNRIHSAEPGDEFEELSPAPQTADE